MILTHSITDPDPYMRPQFTLWNRITRFAWSICWTVFCRYSPVPLHNYRIWFLRLFGGKIADQTLIYPSCKIWAPWLLETEEKAVIGPYVEIYNPGGVLLKHHSIISQNAFICTATHDYNSADFTYIKKAIVIEPYAWICSRAIVLPGVTCAEGSVLGAGSLTSKDLAAWTVYAGNPAVAVKKRRNFSKD